MGSVFGLVSQGLAQGMEPRQKWLTYLLTGILPFVLVINANFIQLENNHDNTVSMFLRRNISIQLRTFKESSFKQRTFILKTGDSIIHGEINLWLSGLANTGTSVKSEFQKTTNFFFFTGMCQILPRICFYSKIVTYRKYKCNSESHIFPSNPRWIRNLGACTEQNKF